jgi:PadR family transcriptional regulator, regulatory protein PadR
MRRKPGVLLPIEESILDAALRLQLDGTGEFHGYAIAKQLTAQGDTRKLTAHGTLYKALDRLEAAGLVESRWEAPADAAAEDRPRRRFYVLTGAGAVALSNCKAAKPRATPVKRPRLATP